MPAGNSSCSSLVAAKARGHWAQRFTGAVALRVDCPAMLGLAARRATHYVRFAHCVRTSATRMFTNRAAREAASPALLGAPEARCNLSPHAFADALLVFGAQTKHIGSRQAVPGGGDLWGAEEHSPGVGARSALRKHSRRACPNAVGAAHVVSCATGRKTDNEVAAKADNCAKRLSCRSQHRRAVDAKRDRTSEALRPVPTRLCRDTATGNMRHI